MDSPDIVPNSILMLLIAQSFNFLQAILGGKVEVPTLSGKMQINVRQDLHCQFFLLLFNYV